MSESNEIQYAQTPHPMVMALVEYLGLDVNRIQADGFLVEVGPSGLVNVTWKGVAWMPIEEFQAIMDSAGVSISNNPTS